jgi:hypothetical protein
VDRHMGLSSAIASALHDARAPDRITHPLRALFVRAAFALASQPGGECDPGTMTLPRKGGSTPGIWETTPLRKHGPDVTSESRPSSPNYRKAGY